MNLQLKHKPSADPIEQICNAVIPGDTPTMLRPLKYRILRKSRSVSKFTKQQSLGLDQYNSATRPKKEHPAFNVGYQDTHISVI